MRRFLRSQDGGMNCKAKWVTCCPLLPIGKMHMGSGRRIWCTLSLARHCRMAEVEE